MLWKYGSLLFCLTVAIMIQGAVARSVTGICMKEQLRVLNATYPSNQKQEDQLVNHLDIICRSITSYVNCFIRYLPNAFDVGDLFTKLMYDPISMAMAYKGLCTLDLEDLHEIRVCLMKTPESAPCYEKYEAGVKKVIEFQDQNLFLREDLQNMACDIFVGRYQCETEIYGKCNKRAKEIMQDFVYASLSPQCRKRTAVTSRYLTEIDADSFYYEPDTDVRPYGKKEKPKNMSNYTTLSKILFLACVIFSFHETYNLH